MGRKYKAKADKKQPEIVAGLRKKGMTVAHTHMIGRGFPDIVVGYKRMNFLVEIKNNEKGKLTSDEKRWVKGWGGSVIVGHSANQIEAEILNQIKNILAQKEK